MEHMKFCQSVLKIIKKNNLVNKNMNTKNYTGKSS